MRGITIVPNGYWARVQRGDAGTRKVHQRSFPLLEYRGSKRAALAAAQQFVRDTVRRYPPKRVTCATRPGDYYIAVRQLGTGECVIAFVHLRKGRKPGHANSKWSTRGGVEAALAKARAYVKATLAYYSVNGRDIGDPRRRPGVAKKINQSKKKKKKKKRG
jgi:hypothetical protein